MTFAGWVPHARTIEFYQQADIFCFPSLREFGGAVVLEAMGNGLPCLVVDHGGIGEYVTAQSGVKIAPIAREYIVRLLSVHIERLAVNPLLRDEMGRCAIARAREYAWAVKAQKIVSLYEQVTGLSSPTKTVAGEDSPNHSSAYSGSAYSVHAGELQRL